MKKKTKGMAGGTKGKGKASKRMKATGGGNISSMAAKMKGVNTKMDARLKNTGGGNVSKSEMKMMKKKK